MEQQIFPSLNVINGIPSPYGSKEIIRHYHYRSDTKLDPGIVEIRRILCSCNYFTTILSIIGIQEPKKKFISLDMVGFIISNTLKLLVVTITGF